jgi:hypothetical protein
VLVLVLVLVLLAMLAALAFRRLRFFPPAEAKMVLVSVFNTNSLMIGWFANISVSVFAETLNNTQIANATKSKNIEAREKVRQRASSAALTPRVVPRPLGRKQHQRFFIIVIIIMVAITGAW